VGLGGEVVAGVGKLHKALGGAIAFGSVALTKALCYKASSMSVAFRNGRIGGGTYLGLTIGNGPYCGGGMKLVPDALVDDGHFDVLLIHDMSVTDRLITLAQIYTGRHVDLPHCSVQKTTGITVQSQRPVPVAADGELLGTTPCTIEVLPGAIQVRRPAYH
jgi:diacylglycerol kinase family enzyme